MGSVRIGVDYGRFAGSSGGNYGSRLHLVQLLACAVTTPQLASCRTQTALPGAGNYARTQNVYAQPAALSAVTGTTMVLAVTSTQADGGGNGGTYTATSLKPSDQRRTPPARVVGSLACCRYRGLLSQS